MATVSSYTKEHMDTILDQTIASAEIVSGDLVFTTIGSDEINVGQVVGTNGTNGAPGATGSTGATGPAGPAGPTALVGDPVLIATSTGALSTSGVIVGLSRTNVPVTINHTYSLNVDFDVDWSSVDVDAEWHFWVRLNGANLEKFAVLRPVVLGISFQKVRGVVFWDAPATLATDDFDVFAQEIVNGATITPTGSSTLKRKFWIVDHGVVT